MTWSLKDRMRRREKLQAWLAPPDENGEGTGRLYRKSYEEIAAALSHEFNRKISKWSARNYVRNLWQLEERKGRLHVGGRPRASHPDVDDPGATEDTSRRRSPQQNGPPADKAGPEERGYGDILVGAFRDVMQLCDIATAELHRLLKNCPDLKGLVGSKSSMHKMLARDGEQKRREVFPLPRPRDRLAFALSLHQLVLLGPGCLRVILLACELRTLYLNAQIFEVHLPWQDYQTHLRSYQPGLKRMGTPALRFKDDWQAIVSQPPQDDPCPFNVALLRDAIEDFVVDTCQKLPAKVHAIFFNKRVRYDGGFTSAEEFKPDKVRVIEAPTAGQQFLPIQAWQSLTTEKFTTLMTNVINSHNRANVYPLWDQYWSGIDRWQAYVPSSPIRVRGVWSSE